MKGYFTANGYCGLVGSRYVLFASEADYYEAINSCLDARSFVVGEMPWNFADFGTQQGPLRPGGNRKGLFTRDRRPKMAAHYFRKRWSEK